MGTMCPDSRHPAIKSSKSELFRSPKPKFKSLSAASFAHSDHLVAHPLLPCESVLRRSDETVMERMAKNGNECQRMQSSLALLRSAAKIFFRRAGRSGRVSRLERIRGQCVMTVAP